MSPQEEPDYRTAYEKTGAHICPETGRDLSGWKKESVHAYIQDLYPDYARENFSEEAKARRAILLKIAEESN